MTPKRAEATCLIAERRESPLASSCERRASSPPSPLLERPPRRLSAIASVSCASLEIEPSDIAPDAKRRTISLEGSTSSSGSGSPAGTSSISPRSAPPRRFSSSAAAAKARVALGALVAHGALQRAR